MIVYRTDEVAIDVQAALASQRRRLAARPDSDALLAVFLEFSELETGLTDALMAQADELSPLTAALRTASLGLARAYLRSAWGRDSGAALEAARRAHGAVGALLLPPLVHAAVPEGYAHYGVHPLAFAVAAARFAGERPGSAVCIGLRSIGTGLSAMVGAALAERGWNVDLHTLRPRGHPFDRKPSIGPLLAGAWRNAHAQFLVIDEGPGLSGSSLCGVAEALNTLGIPDERIALFSSWDPPAAGLRSPAARTRWPRQRKMVAEWHPPEFLAEARDVSAGAWRETVFDVDHEHPAVHPQHERRKYVVQEDGGARLYRFAGLAHYGEPKLARAAVLAEAGFGPVPGALREGYLDYRYLTGRPLRPGEASRAFLDTVAHYLAFMARHFALPRSTPHQATAAMLVENAGELLGEPWRERAAALARDPAVAEAPAVALDGRMFPHEWLVTPLGFRKTDGLDHHADHFFPGCNDIAWDLATVTEEFQLLPEAADVLLTRYMELSGDKHAARRLPFQRAAYLAHRLGYVTLARESLADTPDGQRFAILAHRYAQRLREALP